MIITSKHEVQIFSQNGEDGIIRTILDVVGEAQKTFVEIGTGPGIQCNCINLRKNHKWKGVLVDAAYGNDDVHKRYITAENAVDTLHDVGAPTRPDVFSIDIDGNDWYVLRRIGEFLPTRVLVCEFNGHFQWSECMAMPYDPQFKYKGTRFYGGSQRAMHLLVKKLGYSMVYSKHPNAFFVPNEFASRFDNADNIEKLYDAPWSHIDDERMHLMVDPFDAVGWTKPTL